MKTLSLFVTLLLLLLAAPAPRARAAASDPLDQTFQAAILAEEARRDLSAAIRGYEEVVAKVDAQRTLAATAVFRLGECYRKVGRTNDAVGQYQRLIRDFPSEETLARLSRENLTALGVTPASPTTRPADGLAEAGATPTADPEAEEIRRLRKLIDQSPDLLNATTPPSPNTPLVIAAERGELAVVRALIGWGADVTRGANRGDTALIGAARAGHKAIVETLLEAKADPNVANRDGKTALAMAVERRHMAVVDTLLSRGTTPAKDPENSALFAAVETAQTNLIERLVRAGADVNQDRPRNVDSGNNRPATPLEAAVSLPPNRRAGIVRTLLRLGAVPVGTVQNHPVAVVGRSTTAVPELLKDLIQASSKEQLPEGLLDRLLAEAVRNPGRVDTLPVLLAAGASVDSPTFVNETGSPLICLAAEIATPRALEILLAAKPDLTVVNSNGETPLHLAAIRGKAKNLELLLQAGAEPNTLNPSDETPLTYVRQQIARFSPAPPRTAAPGLVQGPMPAMQVPGIPGSMGDNSPASLKDYQAAEAQLLAHGAREDIVRRLQITAYRGTEQQRLLRRSGDDPAPRLSDILLLAFSGSSTWNWPQLSALRIDRLQPDGQGETRIAIPADWINQQDCAWNIPLQWGDAIQIPEEDHVQGQGWPGLPEAAVKGLARCSNRRVTLVIKDESQEIELLPAYAKRQGITGIAVNTALTPIAEGGSNPGRIKAPESLPTCQLGPVLAQSRVLRLSSDLARVRVTRAATSQTWTLDVANDPRAQTFWLLDGDRIEVLEKQP